MAQRTAASRADPGLVSVPAPRIAITIRIRRDVMGRSGALSLAMAFLLVATQIGAAKIEPSFYVNTPVNSNFALAGYAYSDGSLSITSAVPIKDAEFEGHSGILAYVRTFGIQ